jgi:hypothetical protein
VALADYYQRGALAAAQVLAGFDEEIFRARLTGTVAGITFGARALNHEGSALTDLLVRLLARLYPTLAIRGGIGCEERLSELIALAQAINPAIEIVQAPTIEVIVGPGTPAPVAASVIYSGSSGWDAKLSRTTAQDLGTTRLPFGAAASACLAAANLFRAVFMDSDPKLDADLSFSTYSRAAGVTSKSVPTHAELSEPVVLAGCGAIGNAAVWALGRADVRGSLALVDDQVLELSNMQRYVLATRADEERAKVEITASALTGALRPEPHRATIADFLTSTGYEHDRVLLALDSARDRRQAQTSLPRWIANAWTQPGDLGVSVHQFGVGACVCCLYLPEGKAPNEDELVTGALKLPAERLMEVRLLLDSGAGLQRPLLEAVAASLGVAIEKLLPFEGKPIRALYVEGVCGGAVIPLGQQTGATPQELHVPLAHQSALAGVLLAAALMRDAVSTPATTTTVTRIDLLSAIGADQTRPALPDPREICICQDADYARRYTEKYAETRSVAKETAAALRGA